VGIADNIESSKAGPASHEKKHSRLAKLHITATRRGSGRLPLTIAKIRSLRTLLRIDLLQCQKNRCPTELHKTVITLIIDSKLPQGATLAERHDQALLKNVQVSPRFARFLRFNLPRHRARQSGAAESTPCIEWASEMTFASAEPARQPASNPALVTY